MTDAERAALDALRTFALAVRAYHAVVDADTEFCPSLPYINAANAMDRAEAALIDAAEPLLDQTADPGGSRS